MLKTQEYANVIGETYNVVRNVFGREGRAPRNPGPRNEASDFASGKHRRFVFADALAWRITRELCELGMEWDSAAAVVFQERPADRYPSDGLTDQPQFFAVWATSAKRPAFTGWMGTISEISEILEQDNSKYGLCHPVRMISINVAYDKTVALIEAAGYQLVDGDIEAQAAS